jgi:hypothetical protein
MKKRKPIPRVGQLLKSDKTLQALQKQCSKFDELLTMVRTRLPDPLCDHCISATLEANQLTLYVDSPAWLHRLRFMQGTLDRDLAPMGIHFTSLRVKVLQRPSPDKQGIPRHMNALSPSTAAMLAECAATIDDTQLSDALLRLSTHSDQGEI